VADSREQVAIKEDELGKLNAALARLAELG